VLSLSLDYVERVPALRLVREDLQDAVYDLSMALASGWNDWVQAYVEECRGASARVGAVPG
jgi:hypothetical protein